MANVSGKELNSEFLAKIDAKINELYSEQGTIKPDELTELNVDGQKKYILNGNRGFYNQLNDLKRILSFSEIDELNVFKFRSVAFRREDENKFKNILNYSRFLRDEFVRELIDFNSVGYLPGYNGKVYAPLPRLDGQSIASYEKYLKDYYASFNIYVGIDETTGVRKPYPHELCQWENGVPRQGEKNYRNQYYREFVEKNGKKDLNTEEAVIVNADEHENSEENTVKSTPLKPRATKAKFRVKEKQDFKSVVSRIGNFAMEAPDKINNLDKALGSDKFWYSAVKGIKRAGLVVIGGGLAIGAVALLGSQFIGSFSTPGWVALGTGSGSSLAVLPFIGQLAISVAPIIGVSALVIAYIKLRQRYKKRREEILKNEEEAKLREALKQDISTESQELTKNLTEESGPTIVQSDTPTEVPVTVAPTIAATVPEQTPAVETNVAEQNAVEPTLEVSGDFQQDPFLQLDSLVGMIKKDREYISQLEDRKITVESNGSADAGSVLNEIENQAKMLNDQIKGNMKNIAQLCMSYNHNFDDTNNLTEGGMSL